MGELRRKMGTFELVVGVDRLDYTKGIPERLMAFRNAIERFPELREKVILFQVTVPSREGVAEYQTLKGRIEQLVGEINGEFSTAGWVPVHYHYKSLVRRDLISLYRMARVGFVTSLKDGMNLVAKEFCACQVDCCGVLVLSEFAGAAAQLQRGALLVNPNDIEGMADALKVAFDMGDDERRRRMESMQEVLRSRTSSGGWTSTCVPPWAPCRRTSAPPRSTSRRCPSRKTGSTCRALSPAARVDLHCHPELLTG